jgi:translation initiation factor 2 subunit 1
MSEAEINAVLAATDDAPLTCRMYENQFPEVEELVMVKVRQIAEMGAYVSLMEYNGIEGMILLSELSRRRIRSVTKLIRVGRSEVVVVLRVDKEKGYIDLSKRRVSPEDVKKMEEKFYKSKTVHSIMKYVAETQNLRLEDLYKQFCWPLYKQFGHAFDAFKLALQEPEKVFGSLLPAGPLRDVVLANIQHRLTPRAVRIRADIEVTCFAYDGIDSVKAALNAGFAASTQEIPVSIQLVAPPHYVMHVNCLEQDKGIEILNNAINFIRTKIIDLHGNIVIKSPPRSVSETDEKRLASMMAELERVNTEIDGDDDNSDDDDENSDGKVKGEDDDSSSSDEDDI